MKKRIISFLIVAGLLSNCVLALADNSVAGYHKRY